MTWRWLPVTLLALAAIAYPAAAWQVAPGFYDGLAPMEPYRWISPPAGVPPSAARPQPGHSAIKVGTDGKTEDDVVATGDGPPPQALASFDRGALTPPGNGGSVDVTLTPEGRVPPPESAKQVSNVYCLRTSSPLADGQKVNLTLVYATQMQAPNAIYFLPENGSAWSSLSGTVDLSLPTISAPSTGAGCFVAVVATGASAPTKQSGGQLLPILVAGAILLVILAGAPLAVMRRRGRAKG